MRVAVTGTPGTGKTSATRTLSRAEGSGGNEGDGTPNVSDVEVIHLNEHVETERLYTGIDEARDSLVADVDGLAEWLDGRETDPDARREHGDDGDDDGATLVVESHLAHLLPADRVVVLRCHPEELRRRLGERGVGERKANENAESEALDVILTEAVSRHGTENVYEIDTTERTPAEVGEEIAAVLRGEQEPSAGTVSFLDFFD